MGLGSLRVQQLPVNGAAYGIAPLLRQKGAGLLEGSESSHAAPIIAIILVVVFLIWWFGFRDVQISANAVK